MRPNPLIERAPSSYEVDGASWHVDTSHVTGIRISLMLEDPRIDRRLKGVLMLRNYFSGYADDRGRLPDPLTTADAVTWATWFFSRGVERAGNTGHSHGRNFSWRDDSDRVISDFQRFYSIDLTDLDSPLHWWRFMALFEGLGDESETMQAIAYRAMEVPRKASDAEKKRIRKLKKLYSLEPLTADEYRAQQDAMWGV